jgi:hypothetical protein
LDAINKVPARALPGGPRLAAPAPVEGAKLAGDSLSLGRHRHVHSHGHVHGKKHAGPRRDYAKHPTKTDPSFRAFYADLRRKREALADRLAQDPLLSRKLQPGVFKQLNNTQKLEVARRIAQLEGEVLGFKPATMAWSKKRMDKGLYGEHEEGKNGGTGKVTLNPRENGDVKEFVDTILHEQFHEYQEVLIHGKFPAGDPRRLGQQIYKENSGDNYVEAPTTREEQRNPKAAKLKQARYEAQPSEADAFDQGTLVMNALYERLNRNKAKP